MTFEAFRAAADESHPGGNLIAIASGYRDEPKPRVQLFSNAGRIVAVGWGETLELAFEDCAADIGRSRQIAELRDAKP